MKTRLFSHHAHFLVGPDSIRRELILQIEKDGGISAQGNPDFFAQSYEIFTVDDARNVRSAHGMRPVAENGKKVFVLSMNGITVEAQNALLKLLEEPAEYAHFFIIIPSAHLLLPTVKSRMQLLDISKEAKRERGKENKRMTAEDRVDPELLQAAKKFVSLSKPKRLEEIKRLVEDIAKEKKTKQAAIDLLNAIQAIIYEQKGAKEGKPELEAIEMARNYIHDRAPSVKMLLEYVALSVL